MAKLIEAALVHNYVLVTEDTNEAEELNYHGQAEWLKTQKWFAKDGSDLTEEAVTELQDKIDEVISEFAFFYILPFLPILIKSQNFIIIIKSIKFKI